LVRLETRFHPDSAVIRRAIELPLDMFAGPSIPNMAGGTLDDLRALRRAIDAIGAPSEK
jgi:hypothetical protein